MTPEGYDMIQAALRNENIAATITPHPQGGEDFRYVQIAMNERYLSSFRMLNVLDKAGLMHSDGERDAVFTNGPQLHPLTLETGQAIFEDKNAR